MIEAISAVFNVNALITAINVFILFFVAGYFGSGMAKGFLEKRRQAVTDARQAAATARHREELKDASAKAEADRILERAKVEAELEKKRVNDEIKQEIIDYASVAARKLIADNIDAQYSDEVIRESLDGIGEGVWQN